MSATIDVRGLPETKALLDQFQGAPLNAKMRRSLRRGAKVFREGLRKTAISRSDLPKSFRKTRTRSHRNPLGVSVSPKSPLSTIFEGGAKGHQISGALLSNFNRPSSAGGEPTFFARGGVHHPGMAARPFIVPTFEANERKATDAMKDELFEGVR